MPKRIQLRRTKGWRKPAGAVVVSRPTRWGNPFVVGEAVWMKITHEGSIRRTTSARIIDDPRTAVAFFRAWLKIREQARLLQAARMLLAGKDLACWCPLDQPCHADVLLELANQEPA